jgi:hypothetical protein
MVHSIKFGTHGVLVQWETDETFYPSEAIDEHAIRRIGCRVEFHKKGSDKVPFWHCKNPQDAIDFMEWVAHIERIDKCENEEDCQTCSGTGKVEGEIVVRCGEWDECSKPVKAEIHTLGRNRHETVWRLPANENKPLCSHVPHCHEGWRPLTEEEWRILTQERNIPSPIEDGMTEDVRLINDIRHGRVTYRGQPVKLRASK